jgi:hypothetical protein
VSRIATVIVLTLASLVLASVALADVPGVHRETRLEPIASFAAGKPVKVLCGDDTPGWAQAVASQYGVANPRHHGFRVHRAG